MLGETQSQERPRHSRSGVGATSYTREGADWMQVNRMRPLLAAEQGGGIWSYSKRVTSGCMCCWTEVEEMERLPLDLVRGYTSLFVHRCDTYAVQQRDGSYWRMVEPLTMQGLCAHLAGHWTLGTYLLDQDSQCSFAVFDADRVDGLTQLVTLAEELRREGIPSLLEASRRGGHLWLHLVEATPAWKVRAWLLPYASVLGVELYPKQDALAPGGSGSLIRLPLGLHQQSRGWYPFLARAAGGEWVPVGETVRACCAWAVAHVERGAVPDEVVYPFSIEVAASVPAPLRSIITGVIGVPASRCLAVLTRIGIVTPGGVLVICLTSCVCTTRSRHRSPGNGCAMGHSSKRRWVVQERGCGCGWGLSLASVPTDHAAGVRDGSGKWWWGVVVDSWAAVSTRGWGRGPAR